MYNKEGPLTWEELETRVGKPVWLVCGEEPYSREEGFWGILLPIDHSHGRAVADFYTMTGIWGAADFCYGKPDKDGYCWTAYDHVQIKFNGGDFEKWAAWFYGFCRRMEKRGTPPLPKDDREGLLSVNLHMQIALKEMTKNQKYERETVK
jgi:hypothetical protein